MHKSFKDGPEQIEVLKSAIEDYTGEASATVFIN